MDICNFSFRKNNLKAIEKTMDRVQVRTKEFTTKNQDIEMHLLSGFKSQL